MTTERPSVLLERAVTLIEQRAAAVQPDDLPIIDGTAEWTDWLMVFVEPGPASRHLVAWMNYARVMYEVAERRAKYKTWDAIDNHVSESDRAALEFARSVLSGNTKEET